MNYLLRSIGLLFAKWIVISLPCYFLIPEIVSKIGSDREFLGFTLCIVLAYNFLIIPQKPRT